MFGDDYDDGSNLLEMYGIAGEFSKEQEEEAFEEFLIEQGSYGPERPLPATDFALFGGPQD